MRYLSVKNLSKFQHYKDRRPPWIKLHASLLDDYLFAQMPDVQKAHLMLIWVLASQNENKLPKDAIWVAQRIGANDPVDLDALIAAGFLVAYAGEEPESGWGSRYIPREIKEAVFVRDRGRCVACSTDQNIEYDHRTPVSKGGNSTADNLQLLCRSCNRAKRVRSAGSEPAEHGGPIERSPETETETEKRHTGERKERPRDELFEAIARECGLSLDGLTKTARGGLNAARKEIADAGGIPADVGPRVRAYMARYPKLPPPSPSALAKHWPSLVPVGSVASDPARAAEVAEQVRQSLLAHDRAKGLA